MMEMNLPPSSDNYDDGAFITFYNQSPSTLYLPVVMVAMMMIYWGGPAAFSDSLVTANYDHDGDCVCGSSKSFT